MDSISEIRKKVKKSINRANNTTLKMIYAMLEVQEKESQTKEQSFNIEMQRRIDDFENGSAKTFSHEELVAHVRTAHKNRMQSVK